jgi:hypothetical protein
MVSVEHFTLVNPASNRNGYQEYFLVGKGGRLLRLTTLPLSYADCLEIWEPQTPETLAVCTGTAHPVAYIILAEIALVSLYKFT